MRGKFIAKVKLIEIQALAECFYDFQKDYNNLNKGCLYFAYHTHGFIWRGDRAFGHRSISENFRWTIYWNPNISSFSYIYVNICFQNVVKIFLWHLRRCNILQNAFFTHKWTFLIFGAFSTEYRPIYAF